MTKQFSDYHTDEGYTPEAQAIIDDWEQRLSDDPGMFAQLVLMHDVAEGTMIRLKAELFAINEQVREQLTKWEQAYMAEHAALVDAKAQLAAVPGYVQYVQDAWDHKMAAMSFGEWYRRKPQEAQP